MTGSSESLFAATPLLSFDTYSMSPGAAAAAAGATSAASPAAPMTYRLKADGKQFVVIAAGGHAMMGTKQGDGLIAYTLGD